MRGYKTETEKTTVVTFSVYRMVVFASQFLQVIQSSTKSINRCMYHSDIIVVSNSVPGGF